MFSEAYSGKTQRQSPPFVSHLVSCGHEHPASPSQPKAAMVGAVVLLPSTASAEFGPCKCRQALARRSRRGCVELQSVG